MTDPAVAATLVRSICALPEHDYGDVLRRLDDPAHAKLSRGTTWSIFKALDGMDDDERTTLRTRIVEHRAKTAVPAGT